MNEAQAKEAICEIGRRIWQRGFCAGNEGNHSIRIGDRIVCTPSQISKGFMKPEDIAVCDMEGNQISGPRKRSSEVLLHLAIYRARPDAGAVVHGHPPHATAFAVSGIELPTCVHPEAEVFLGKVPTVPYVTPGDHRLGDSVLPYVKDAEVLLLESHGVVTFDKEIEQAYYKFEVVEAYARMLLLVNQLGQVKRFSQQQMVELMVLKKRFGLSDPRMISNDFRNDSAFID